MSQLLVLKELTETIMDEKLSVSKEEIRLASAELMQKIVQNRSKIWSMTFGMQLTFVP